MNIQEILSRFSEVKQKGKGRYMALCPVHNEKTPSLAISEINDGKILLHCFGCDASAYEIVSAVGLELSDLFPESLSVNYDKPKRQRINSADVLYALKFEAVLVQTAAEMMAIGYTLKEDDILRLQESVKLIKSAVSYLDE